MAEINWELLGAPVDIPGAIQQGFQTGRALRTQHEQDSALHALSTNPDDSAAQNALMAVNPELAIHYQQASLARQDAMRKGQARLATSGVIRAFAPMSGPAAFAAPAAAAFPSAQQNAPALLPPPIDASLPGMVAPPAPIAPASAPDAPAAPQGAPAASGGVLDPSHPVTQSVGEAVSSQRMSQSEAVAELARYADPEQIQQVLGTIKAMDGMRLSQLSEANDAIGVTAQTLLGIPDDPQHSARRQALMAQADQLAQHGVTQEQLASADLSDAGLHGRIGQAIGVKAMIEEADKDRTAAREDATLTETSRHNRATEGPKFQSVTVHNPDGSERVVSFNPETGLFEDVPNGGAAATGGQADGKFDTFFNTFLQGPHGVEGGYANRDGASGAPVNFGVNQKYNPGVDVKNLTREGAAQILHDKYWVASGANALPPGLAEIQADTAINMGPGVATRLLAQSHGDPEKYLELRDARYRSIGGPSLQTWLNRNNTLRQYVGLQDGAAPANLHGVTSISSTTAGTDAGLSGSALDNAARTYNMTGNIPPSLGRGGLTQKAILNRAAELAGGTDTGDLVAGRASRKADTSALQHLQTTSANVLAFERTAQANGKLALSLAGKANVGSVPVFNRWVNAGRKEVSGDPDISAFNAAVETFANEYARITASATGGGVTSDSAREHVHAMINSAQAPAQFRAVMSTLFKDMENRRVGLEQERQQLLGRIRGGDEHPASPGAGGIPTLTPEQVRAAAPGTLFRTTDGRTMRKR